MTREISTSYGTQLHKRLKHDLTTKSQGSFTPLTNAIRELENKKQISVSYKPIASGLIEL